MSKHTPGPWKAFPSGVYAESRDGICIAARHNEERGEWGQGNATLIAAAPDLLEACRAFAALWPVLPDRSEPKATPEVLAAWHAARAAIAKAEGR